MDDEKKEFNFIYDYAYNSYDKLFKENDIKYGFMLGRIDIDEKTYKKLKRYFNFILCNYEEKDYINDNKITFILFLTMVQFAIKEYNTDKFWKQFSYAIDVEYYTAREKTYREIVQYATKNNNLFLYKLDNKGMVITILANSVITKNDNTKIIDFCYNLFIKEFHYIVYDEEINTAFESLKGILKEIGENDKKQYNLPVYFRQAFLNDYEYVKDVCASFIIYLEEYYNKDKIEYMGNENNRYDLMFKEYINKNQNLFNSDYENYNDNIYYNKTINKEGVTHKNKKISNSEYQLYDNDIYLNIKEAKINLPIEDIKDPYVKVYDNDICIFTQALKIRELSLNTLFTKIELDKVYKNLKYELYIGNELIYDSKEKLCRNYYIFSSNTGDEILPKDIKKYYDSNNNEFIMVLAKDASIDNIIFEGAEFKNMQFENDKKYNVYNVTFNENLVILYDNYIISPFNNISYLKYYNTEYNYSGYIKDRKANKYKIYNQLNQISFILDDINEKNDIFIIYQYFYDDKYKDKRYKLTDLKSKFISIGDGSNKSKVEIINMNIEKNVLTRVMIINNKNSKTYFDDYFVILPNFSINFSSDIYFQDQESYITDINLSDFEPKEKLYFPIKIDEKIYNYTMDINVNNYILQLNVIIPKIKLDYNIISNSIWYKDLPDKINIEVPKCARKYSATLFEKENEKAIIDKSLENEKKGNAYYFEYYINLKGINERGIKDYGILNIYFGDKKYMLFNIYLRECITKACIKYYENSWFNGLFYNVEYIGGNSKNIKIEILNLHGQKIYDKKKIDVNKYKQIDNYNLKVGKYRYNIYSCYNDELSCFSNKKPIYTGNFKVGDEFFSKYNNKVIKVKSIIDMNTNIEYRLFDTWIIVYKNLGNNEYNCKLSSLNIHNGVCLKYDNAVILNLNNGKCDVVFNNDDISIVYNPLSKAIRIDSGYDKYADKKLGKIQFVLGVDNNVVESN